MHFAHVRVQVGGRWWQAPDGERRDERVRFTREKRFSKRAGPDGAQKDHAPDEADESFDESKSRGISTGRRRPKNRSILLVP